MIGPEQDGDSAALADPTYHPDSVDGDRDSGVVCFGNLSLSSSTLAVLAAYLTFIGVVLWLSQLGTRAMRLLLAGLAVLIVAGIAALAIVASSGALFPQRARPTPATAT